MKSIFTLAALLLCGLFAKAQHYSPCLFENAVQAMEAAHPGYRSAAKKTYDRLNSGIQNRTDEIYTVQVVVHVVWKENDENIPMSQIEAQMEELNRCYRRRNADTINMRAVFQPVAGDPHIEFNLAEVRRVQTNALFAPTFSLTATTMPDEVKQSDEGGSDAADPDHFLNIWVCKIQPLSIFGQESPILGYAYPPADLDNWPTGSEAPFKNLEGVVIDFRAFGKGSFTVPGVGSLPIEGRTTVHEVGHYLGLRHISGDGFSGLLGIPDCDADDGLADTPNQGFQSQFDCNAAQNTCDEGAGDLPDMIENYMDYSRETCQNTFTKGQVNIMRNVLEGPRRGLLETSSVETPQFEQFIEISPNPSTALFYIKTPADMAVKNLRISDALGRQIEQVSNPATNFIDLSAQPRGVYWLSFYFENGKMSSRKLLKF